jgi:hypothetical protein
LCCREYASRIPLFAENAAHPASAHRTAGCVS